MQNQVSSTWLESVEFENANPKSTPEGENYEKKISFSVDPEKVYSVPFTAVTPNGTEYRTAPYIVDSFFPTESVRTGCNASTPIAKHNSEA